MVPKKNEVVFDENVAFKNFGTYVKDKCKIVLDISKLIILENS